MFAVARKSERLIGVFVLVLTAFLRRVAAAVAPVRVRADFRALGVVGLGDGLFALLDLGGKGCLRRGLRILRRVLGGVNLGRVLRGGQICQL